MISGPYFHIPQLMSEHMLACYSPSKAKHNYSQLDKGITVIILYGLRKAHTFVYGRHATDNKPMITLFGEQGYRGGTLNSYNQSIVHKPGKYISGADCLNRRHRNDTRGAEDVHMMRWYY